MASNQHTDSSTTSTGDVQGGCHTEKRMTEKRVGILYWANTDITWLEQHLMRNSVISESVPLPTEKNIEHVVDERSLCVILYHSQKSGGSVDEIKKYLDYCKKYKDPEDMLIICDQEPDKGFIDIKKHLILTEAEIDASGLIEPNTETANKKITETAKKSLAKVNGIQDLLQKQVQSPEWKNKNKDIGIFSRSDERDYSWLLSLLRTDDKVRPCYISNNGFWQFREDVSQCKFGILYHTKNRGRINVTDVTDSLYDKELQYLSSVLGESNVIVVIDDLEDSSDGMKDNIHKNQPSIGKLSRDLFLFSKEEKLPESIDYVISPQKVNEKKVAEKLDKIVHFIKTRATTNDVCRQRSELRERIDNYKLSHGFTRILLQIYGSVQSDRSTFITSLRSAITNEPQGAVMGSSVPLRGVITNEPQGDVPGSSVPLRGVMMMDNTDCDYKGCRFYLQLGNVSLGENFQETFENATEKIIYTEQNVNDLCVPVCIFSGQTVNQDLKKIPLEKYKQITGLAPVFIWNKARHTGTAHWDKDIRVIDLGKEPAAGFVERDLELLNILNEVLDNVDKKLGASLDRKEEHKKLLIALLTIMHEIFMPQNIKQDNYICNIL